MSNNNITPEEIKKLHSLLTHLDESIQRQGFELTKAKGDYSIVFKQCSFDANGRPVIPFGPANPTILQLWLGAPNFDSSSVQKLNISGWNLNNIDFLKRLTELEHLELQDCTELEELSVLGQLNHLRFLNISNLPLLKDISFLHQLPHLHTLLLSAQKAKDSYPPRTMSLIDFSAIGSLKKLITLDISYQDGLCNTHGQSPERALTFLENLRELRNLNVQSIRPHGELRIEDLKVKIDDHLHPRDFMSFTRLDCIDTGLSSGKIKDTGFVSDKNWDDFLARINHQNTPFQFVDRPAPSVLLGKFVQCEDCQESFVIDYGDDQVVSFEEDIAGLQKTDCWKAYYITLTTSAWFSEPDLGGDGRHHNVCSSCESARDDYPDDYPDLAPSW